MNDYENLNRLKSLDIDCSVRDYDLNKLEYVGVFNVV